MRSRELGITKIGTAEIGLTAVTPREIHATEIGPAGAATRQAGLGEVGRVEIGSIEVHRGEIGPVQVRSDQLRAGEIDPRQIGAGHSESREVFVSELESGQRNRAALVKVLENALHGNTTAGSTAGVDQHQPPQVFASLLTLGSLDDIDHRNHRHRQDPESANNPEGRRTREHQHDPLHRELDPRERRTPAAAGFRSIRTL